LQVKVRQFEDVRNRRDESTKPVKSRCLCIGELNPDLVEGTPQELEEAAS
jgi:hypothetical protein